MPAPQLGLVGVRDARQWDSKTIGGNGETPENVAQLLGQSRVVDRAPLKHSLSNEAQKLRGLFGQAGARVEQTVAVVEGGIDRPEGGVLIVVEIHGVTRS